MIKHSVKETRHQTKRAQKDGVDKKGRCGSILHKYNIGETGDLYKLWQCMKYIYLV